MDRGYALTLWLHVMAVPCMRRGVCARPCNSPHATRGDGAAASLEPPFIELTPPCHRSTPRLPSSLDQHCLHVVVVHARLGALCGTCTCPWGEGAHAQGTPWLFSAGVWSAAEGQSGHPVCVHNCGHRHDILTDSPGALYDMVGGNVTAAEFFGSCTYGRRAAITADAYQVCGGCSSGEAGATCGVHVLCVHVLCGPAQFEQL